MNNTQESLRCPRCQEDIAPPCGCQDIIVPPLDLNVSVWTPTHKDELPPYTPRMVWPPRLSLRPTPISVEYPTLENQENIDPNRMDEEQDTEQQNIDAELERREAARQRLTGEHFSFFDMMSSLLTPENTPEEEHYLSLQSQ